MRKHVNETVNRRVVGSSPTDPAPCPCRIGAKYTRLSNGEHGFDSRHGCCELARRARSCRRRIVVNTSVSPTVFCLASMAPPFLREARSEELRFRVATKRARHSHHILWAMIASSPASGSRVVSAIVSSPSFLRLPMVHDELAPRILGENPAKPQ